MKAFLATLIGVLGAWVASGWCGLTGPWTGDDGGTYYLRQIGEQVYWYGEATATSPTWANVFSGRIEGNRIEGSWAGVPKGNTRGVGTLELIIEAKGEILRVIGKTGAFTGSRWVRQTAIPSKPRASSRLIPDDGEDCARFDPATLLVQQTNGRWRVTAENHWLFDFGRNQTAAQQALNVMRRYRLDRICFLGQPEPTFSYMLAKGGAPLGAMPGEACVAFDPRKLTVSLIQGRWKIVSGGRWLFDFGRNQGDAQQALAIIRQNGFTRSCSVGPPEAEFGYLRR